jgi:hypothetical protein
MCFQMAVMKKWGLKQEKLVQRYTHMRKGTDAEKAGRPSDYKGIWKHIHMFCLEGGLYEDAVLLDREICPDMLLLMSPYAVIYMYLVNSNGISCRLGLVCTPLCICSSSTYRIIQG